MATSLYSNLDFANDVCLLDELLELLVSVLHALATEVQSLGLENSWQKTKVQALSNKQDVPLSALCMSNSRGICLPWCSPPLNNSKYTRHPPSQCTYLHIDAELGQAPAVKNLALNENEALQHLYTAIFFLYGSEGWAITNDQCCPPGVPPYAPWN